MVTRLVADCKSLCDHLKCDGKGPDDQHTAILTAALRCGVGAGQQESTSKTRAVWVPSRWQVADALSWA